MLFTYDKNQKKIALYKQTDLKSHNILERQDIEKWIENYPEIIGEELLILTTEYDKFDKTDERLDLLAIDRTGCLTVIELKRDDSGKNVDLQAIKYAAYCSTLSLEEISALHQRYLNKNGVKIDLEDSREKIIQFITDDEFEEIGDKTRIIIVSKEYRPEVTASVLWLRKFGIDITCVKLTPYEIDSKTIGFESTILIPLPEAKDFIIQSEKKENAENTRTRTQEEYFNFYSNLIEKIKPVLPRQYLIPSHRAYYQIATGISHVHFEWWFHGRPRSAFGIELHFEKPDHEFNKQSAAVLKKIKNNIESAVGEKVVFQDDWGSRGWTRIFIEKNEGKMTEELMDWAVKKTKIFIETIQPELDKIKK